jgi:hypothetical protein
VYQQEVGDALLMALREVDAKRARESADLNRRLDQLEETLARIEGALDNRNGA